MIMNSPIDTAPSVQHLRFSSVIKPASIAYLPSRYPRDGDRNLVLETAGRSG
jgi:hypothetical protein